MPDDDINSRAFWEGYFEEQWSANDGPGQSTHFMLQMLAHMPPRELRWLLGTARAVLDWGCAAGEGTEVLAEVLADSEVYGLDFAKAAIDAAAARRRAAAAFLWHDEGTIEQRYDAIVTSNCLEHFIDPLERATEHIASCDFLYAALVPYREHPLHEQHFAQFRLESFPEEMAGFRRIAEVPFELCNAFWPGEQLLVVYASDRYLALPAPDDPGLGVPALQKSLAVQAEMVVQLSQLAAKSQSLDSRANDLQRSLSEATKEVAEREEALRQARARASAACQEADDARRSLEEVRRRAEELVDSAREREREHNSERDMWERRLREGEREHNSDRAMWERQLRERDKQIEDLASRLGTSTRLLAREEVSVARPLARRAWRGARAMARRMPQESQDSVRAALAPAVKLLAPRSQQAIFYEMARKKRRGLGALPASAPGPQSAEARSASADAERTRTAEFWRHPAEPGDRMTVVVFSVIAWHFRHQRPQQLAVALGERGHTVYYVEPEFGASGKPYEIVGSPAPNIHLCRLGCPGEAPRIYETLLDAFQQQAVAANLASLVPTATGAIVRIVQHPFWTPLMRQWDIGPLVYDMMDDHSGFAGNGGWLKTEEDDLVDIADLVCVSSDGLLEGVPKDKAVMVNNGVDWPYFSGVALPTGQPRSSRVRIGYYGAISHWFDTQMVRYCALARPEWDFELIGSTFGADVDGLEGLPNVRLLGEKPYDEIVAYVEQWDVATIPFRLLDLTKATNPVKAYEYLAAGKPVVATMLPELAKPPLGDWVRCARDADEFLQFLDEEVANAGDVQLAKARRNSVKGSSWSARAEVLERAIYGVFPAVSLVMVCYGRLDLTKECLRTVLQYTSYLHWEVVAVDNCSPDGTAEWLKDVSARTTRLKAICNEENRGFAAGVNIGCRAAKGEYIVVMNNDVRVTPGWLYRLLRHLRVNERLGLAGPVTNAIGNEAVVPVAYDDESAMLEAARSYESSHFREQIPVGNVAFFVVALSRRTWQEVGELDEGYGLGFFEDDDYCRRVDAAGLEIAIAEDVFVHHELSGSFGRLGSVAKQELFERNRVIYEEKWGPWEPHRYRG